MLYVGEPIPGLCSNCHHQNETGALFCSMCGYPFKEVFAEGAPQEVQDFINMLDGETILKLMAKGIEKRIKDGEISL